MNTNDEKNEKINVIPKEIKKDLKVKKPRKKRNVKLFFKEFPVKMAKEINKIRWSGDNTSIFKKFLIVVAFMGIISLFFFGIDLLIKLLFQTSFIF